MFLTLELGIVFFVQMMTALKKTDREKAAEIYFFGFGIFFLAFLVLLGIKYKPIGTFLIIFYALLVVTFGILGAFNGNKSND